MLKTPPPSIADVRIIHYACAGSGRLKPPADNLENNDATFHRLWIPPDHLKNYGCADTGHRLIPPAPISAITGNTHREAVRENQNLHRFRHLTCFQNARPV